MCRSSRWPGVFRKGAGECRAGFQKASKKSENWADVKKGQPEVFGRYKYTKPFQSTIQSIRAAVPASRGNSHRYFETLQKLSLLCHPDKGGREDLFKIILTAKNILEDKKDRSIFDNYGIQKPRVFKLKYGLIISFWLSGTLIFVSRRQYSNPLIECMTCL